jgi:hypothetical protein
MKHCMNKCTIIAVFFAIFGLLTQCLFGQNCQLADPRDRALGKDLLFLEVNTGNITCYDSVVSLVAVANATDATFWWISPDSSCHTGAVLETSLAGFHEVFVRNNSNATIARKTVLVTDSRVYPKVHTLGGQLDCNNLETALHTAAIPQKLNFQWSGPNGFSDNFASPLVTVAGLYTLIATEPRSGCRSKNTAIVTISNEKPKVKATVATALSSDVKEIWLSADGSSKGNNYRYFWWSANGYSIRNFDAPFAKVSTPDVYSLQVTNIENGCSSSTNLRVGDKINLTDANLSDLLPPTYLWIWDKK